MRRLDSPEDYIRLARQSDEEMQALHQDLLISVTAFFRDRHVFQLLADHTLPELFAARQAHGALRVWVPACASGEEAYSLAILMLEQLRARGATMRLQIFATDVDSLALARARRGVFGGHIRDDVRPEWLERYFTARDDGYEVCRRLRDMVVFSPHDLLHNAPFSRMDLISCRNLLIYLRPDSQKAVLSTLHYALAPAGLLLLGASESIGEAPELFSVSDARAKLYLCRRAHAPRGRALARQLAGSALGERPTRSAQRPDSLRGLVDQRLLEAYAPPGALVDEHFEVLQFVGDIGPFLAPAGGAASFSLLRLIRFELHVEVKRAMRAALEQQRRIGGSVTVQDPDEVRRVGVDVIPVAEPRAGHRCLLVLFVDGQRVPRSTLVGESRSADGGPEEGGLELPPARVEALVAELKTTQDYLRGVIEEAEGAREGFRSANEELQSANEELQSTNEELETSKEELQSANEELTTVNEELQGRMLELGDTNDDLYNFLAAAESILVTVDLELVIRRWTVAAEDALDLTAQDAGRHLSCLAGALCCERLADKVSAVIESLSVYDERLKNGAGELCELVISPYRSLDNVVRGAIIRVTPLRSAARVELDVALAAVVQPLFALDADLRLRWGNAAFWRTVGLSPRAHSGRDFRALAFFHGLSPAATARLRGALRHGRQLRQLMLTEGGRRWRLRGSPLVGLRHGPLLLLSIGGVDGP